MPEVTAQREDILTRMETREARATTHHRAIRTEMEAQDDARDE